MNKFQKDYTIATATLEALKEEEKNLEKDYLKENGYNCNVIYAIDSEEEFEKANKEFSEIINSNGLWSKISKAENDQKEAEERLLQYALSIIPFPKERKILEQASRTSWKTRKEMINLVMKLDARKENVVKI